MACARVDAMNERRDGTEAEDEDGVDAEDVDMGT